MVPPQTRHQTLPAPPHLCPGSRVVEVHRVPTDHIGHPHARKLDPAHPADALPDHDGVSPEPSQVSVGTRSEGPPCHLRRALQWRGVCWRALVVTLYMGIAVCVCVRVCVDAAVDLIEATGMKEGECAGEGAGRHGPASTPTMDSKARPNADACPTFVRTLTLTQSEP